MTDPIDIKEWGEGAKLHIGAFCSIATKCTVFLGGNHRVDRITTYPFGHINQSIFHHDGSGHPCTKGDVTIGNDVWIGHNVTIMSGVTIGDGAVIAANSHVVKDVEPYSIYGGNPACLIRYRFSDDIIRKLLQIQWWNWEDTKINEHVQDLCDASRVAEFVNKHLGPL